jgi:hypothetical protein
MLNPIHLTFRRVTAVAVGGILILGGMFMASRPFGRMLGVGVALVGVGLISLGITDGFSDYGPYGRLMYGIGIAGFGLGVPLALYAFYYGGF